MKKRLGIILVAHGSKRQESNEEFVQLSAKIKLENSSEFDEIDFAFLEFEKPNIEMAINNMFEKDLEKVYIYPYFLNSGKHVSVDLPNIINKVQSIYKNMEIEILQHFGSSKSVSSIISSDLQTTLL